MPFLLIISSFFINFKYNASNEIVILKQYFSLNGNINLFLVLFFGIFIFNFLNNEILSVHLYQKYKINELEIRNNLKLGLPASNELHIDNEVSIFFDKKSNNTFYNVNAIIYDDGQFINSNKAKIEIEKKNYNIIFYDGERVILNGIEKSKTIFEKFIYSIENNEIEILMYDKEHFNTLELLKADDKEFYYQGHNRIYQYFLILMIVVISLKVFFIFISKKNVFKFYFLIFVSILFLEVINSYMLFLLNNDKLNLYFYYFINFALISTLTYFILNFNENN